MSDDDHRHDEPDARDERIAATLEVPPLDDLTRRRLVRRALTDAAPAGPGRRARLLQVAAVAVGVAVVGGAAALALRDDGGGGEVADRSAAPTATTEETPAAVSSDLGEVSDPDVLRERLAAAAPPLVTDGSRDRGSDTESFEEEDLASAAALPPACLDALTQQGGAARTLVATATFSGVPVFVVQADSTAGETAFVLDQATCAVISTVSLA